MFNQRGLAVEVLDTTGIRDLTKSFTELLYLISDLVLERSANTAHLENEKAEKSIRKIGRFACSGHEDSTHRIRPIAIVYLVECYECYECYEGSHSRNILHGGGRILCCSSVIVYRL